MSINVLLVEDDIDLASTVVDYFELEDLYCDHAANGVQGLSLIEANEYQVIIFKESRSWEKVGNVSVKVLGNIIRG